MSEKKVIGVIIADNEDCIGNKGKIPVKIPQALDHVKRLLKNNWSIVGKNSYEQIMKAFNPQRVIVLSSEEIEGCITKSSIENAISYINSQKDFQKGEIYVLGGKSTFQYCYDHHLFDEVLKIRVDANLCGDTYLGFSTKLWPLIKVSEVFYQYGFSFWYERYNSSKFLEKPLTDILNEDAINAMYIKEIAADMGIDSSSNDI